jgi:hypothetical protein
MTYPTRSLSGFRLLGALLATLTPVVGQLLAQSGRDPDIRKVDALGKYLPPIKKVG